MDPCLDDCVMFARKLKKLGRPVTLEILKGLPHGFLNFTMVSVCVCVFFAFPFLKVNLIVSFSIRARPVTVPSVALQALKRCCQFRRILH